MMKSKYIILAGLLVLSSCSTKGPKTESATNAAPNIIFVYAYQFEITNTIILIFQQYFRTCWVHVVFEVEVEICKKIKKFF